MSETPARSENSKAATWIIGILAALLLYGFSIGPVSYFIFKGTLSSPLAHGLVELYTPVLWLRDHTPLHRPIEIYLEWWNHLAHRPRH